MTLPKKKSKPMTIGENKFRYILRTGELLDHEEYEHSTYSIVLIAQDDGGEGSVLTVEGLSTTYFGDYGLPKNNHNVPNWIVRECILKALNEGWNPQDKNNFNLMISEKDMWEKRLDK
ncbi:MAG: hypothetical protein ACW99G_07155 [Candidatus Thorarchaeota archaeon]|jgi:hypothetical protein